MQREDCLNKIDMLLNLEFKFNNIKNLSSKDKMIEENKRLSKIMVDEYNQIKGYINSHTDDKELISAFKGVSKIIDLSNQIDDYIRFEVKD